MEMKKSKEHQINDLVAEHVFGWKRGDGSMTSDVERWGNIAFPHKWTNAQGRPEESTPDACEDGNVMLDVIDTMREKGVDQGGDGYEIEEMIWTGTSWEVRFQFDLSEERARAWHMPHAVALAALKVQRVDVRKLI